MKKPLVVVIPVLLLFGTAYALDTPPMKEGLWKLHMVTTSPNAAPMDMTYTICRNHAYDNSIHQMVEKKTGCSINADSISGSKRTYSSSCKVGATTIMSSAVVTWSGDTHFHTETHTTYTPAFSGMTQSTMIQDQTYVGSCPAGMSPGDRMMANGQVQHMH
jgi:hypothetical protein